MLPGMVESQKLTLRASEIRARLSEIAGLPDDDALTAEIRTETDTLTTEYQNVETRLRAAMVAEDEDRQAAELRGGGDDADAETRALRSLQGRASLGRYLQGFADGEQLTGAERELAETRGLSTSGNVLPWDALLPPPRPGAELRDDAVTGAPGSAAIRSPSHAIIQRVFARSAVRRLGVLMPSVGVGQASYPVITAGQAGAFVAADGAVEAAAGTITPNTLAPVRLQARLQFRIEDAMTTLGLESGLADDLTMALGDRLDAQLISLGDANVRGFLATAAHGGLADYADPGDVVTFAAAAMQAARGVDGKYAGSESECSWIDRHGELSENGRADPERTIQPARPSGCGACCATSWHPPTSRPRRATYSKASWRSWAPPTRSTLSARSGKGLRLIRDEVTNAAKGQISSHRDRAAQLPDPAGRWVRANEGQDRVTARRPRCNPSAAGSGGAHGCQAVRPARADWERSEPYG